MSPIKMGKILAVVFLMVQTVLSAVITVAQDGTGTYSSVQEAVDAAKEGDIIEILDDAIYGEQVTIDSTKTGLTLRGDINSKPTIKFQDTKAVYPKTLEQAQDPVVSDSLMRKGLYFEQCGALRILNVRQVTIENIIVDGGGAEPYLNKQVWEDAAGKKSDLFHGNAAIAMAIAGDAIIRNCELTNAYFGISVKDRNVRGVFAEPNPSDIQRDKIVPLSGFGKTGNHIIENNKIHNNSWGMFFESSWDLGSTVRYNLIYSNYHQKGTVVPSGEEGDNQIGGGIYFKDDPLSPVAIYNNTFIDNTSNIGCQWQAGAYHLIFNNIFSKPHEYGDGGWRPANFSFEDIMPSRYKHNIYAQLEQKPQVGAYDVRIDADMTLVTKPANGPVALGAIIIGGAKWKFPSDANNRWLEPEEIFVSTDPEDDDFLVPDWDKEAVAEFIHDKGWGGAGIKDDDGSPADIGAISKEGAPETSVGVKPINPVIISGGNATVSFNVYPIAGELTNMKVKYVKWMGDLPKDTAWGNQVNKGAILNRNKPAVETLLDAGDVVTTGLNTLAFPVSQTGKYAYMEMVVEGEDASGNIITTNVGFMPYRELEYVFNVGIYGTDESTSKLESVQVGQTVYLEIKPVRVDEKPIAAGTAKENELSLISPYGLESPDGKAIKAIDNIKHTGIRIPVVFKKIPDQKFDAVMVNGTFYPDGGDGAGSAVMGTSDQIIINPGDPARVEFIEQSRDEKFRTTIQPSEVLLSKLQVYDIYGNEANKPAKVTLKSTKPEIGGPAKAIEEGESDASGVVSFDGIEVNNGGTNDKFELVAELFWEDKSVDEDTAYLKVGDITERLVILYSDLAGYDPTIGIESCSGERVPVTIRAMDGSTLKTERNIDFSIDFDPQSELVAYESETSTETIKTATLVNGEAKIWIQAKVMEVNDASIKVSPVGIRTIGKGNRGNITFTYCDNPIVSASYIADNGNGSVSGAVVKFRDSIVTDDDYPSELVFYWPDLSSKRNVEKAGMKVSADDKTVITVTFDKPFDSLKTFTAISELGECIRVNAELGVTNTQKFKIADKVGPLLMSAIVVERPEETGDDTLYLTFSELLDDVKALADDGLLLIKAGKSSVLNVVSAQNISTDTIRVVVENTDNALSPKEGDLLRINPEGKVIDKEGNLAHKDNRPVSIMQKEVPPSVVNAFYYDKNGNGIVDTVIIEFNKIVNPKFLSAVITWSNKKNSGKLEPSQFVAVGGENSTKVAVDVNGKFKDLGIKTSDNMNLKLDYKSEQVSTTIGTDIFDKAAPVIISAVYHPGTVAQLDTIHVTFSEKLKDPTSSKTPFLFYRDKSTEYGMELKCQSVSGNTVKYLVEKITNDKILIPVNKDSVRISVNVYSDELGNVQEVKANRLAPVKVADVPIEFTVKVGPNPFRADGQNYITIKVDPQTKMLENVDPQAKVRIYDAVGNIVHDAEVKVDKDGKLEFRWNGRNLHGRYVASGTYLAIVEASDAKTGKTMSPFRKAIGVKR